MVFQLSDPKHRQMLLAHLDSATTLVGKDMQFDLLYLRTQPDFREVLTSKTHRLIDLSVINYLHSELRPEKSLKDLGLVLGTHKYDRTLKDGLWTNPNDSTFISYNAQDTHNTLLSCFVLGDAIQSDFPGSDKLSPHCLGFFSDLLWACIRMSEAGIPMSRDRLQVLEGTLEQQQAAALAVCKDNGLLISGKGSVASQQAFITRIIETIDTGIDPCKLQLHTDSTKSQSSCASSLSVSACVQPSSPLEASFLGHSELEISKITHIVSWNQMNRDLFLTNLPENHQLAKVLEAADEFASSRRTVSADIAPLLTQRRPHTKRKSVYDSILIDELGYANWHAVRSIYHDTDDQEYGQIQARPGVRNPEAQKWHPDVRACMKSRWEGGVILSMDLSQHELNTGGMLSGERSIIDAANAGTDLHTARAIGTFGYDNLVAEFGLPLDKYNVEFAARPRTAGKHGNFGDFFLASASKLQWIFRKKAGIHVDLCDCQKMVSDRPLIRPELWAWQQRIIHDTHKRGYYVLPLTGHSRGFLPGPKYDHSEIVNFPIQAVASITLCCIKIHLEKSLPCLNDPSPEILLFLNHYDSLAFDCKTSLIASSFQHALKEAVSWVASEGYWAWWKDYTGNDVPLNYEITIH